MSKQHHRNVLIGVLTLFLILLCIDRYYWAQIAQWREDQATNLWLGYTMPLTNIPVGLISSTGIPNPNGMILLGFFLSKLPTLLSISFFLGLLQIFFTILTGWKASGGDLQFFLLATLPIFTSVVLRSSSIEFWNQYTITMVNIAFLFWALRYLQNLSLWNIPPIACLILLAPSLYLAGLVNAITMTIITLGMLIYKRPTFKGWGTVLAITAFIGILSIFMTWTPYFQTVNWDQLTNYSKTSKGMFDLFRIAWEAIFGIPNYVTFQWASLPTLVQAFKHSDSRIISRLAQLLLRFSGRAYLLQAVLAFTTIFYVIWVSFLNKTTSLIKKTVNLPALQTVMISAAFIALSYTISGWLGGPNWVENERPDQIVQFLPLFLLLVFLLPVAVAPNSKKGRIIHISTYGSLAVFVTVNLLCGFFIIQNHLEYHGKALTEADVPLIDKTQVVEFIAADWRQYSTSDTIAVDYELNGNWEWVPEFGIQLERWYPAPMTQGRSFDYELLRRYGLKNRQEGIQLRSFGNSRYLVTYSFKKPPEIPSAKVIHHIFGRLRVSVVEK